MAPLLPLLLTLTWVLLATAEPTRRPPDLSESSLVPAVASVPTTHAVPKSIECLRERIAAVLAQEVRIECDFPANEATEAWFRGDDESTGASALSPQPD